MQIKLLAGILGIVLVLGLITGGYVYIQAKDNEIIRKTQENASLLETNRTLQDSLHKSEQALKNVQDENERNLKILQAQLEEEREVREQIQTQVQQDRGTNWRGKLLGSNDPDKALADFNKQFNEIFSTR